MLNVDCWLSIAKWKRSCKLKLVVGSFKVESWLLLNSLSYEVESWLLLERLFEFWNRTFLQVPELKVDFIAVLLPQFRSLKVDFYTQLWRTFIAETGFLSKFRSWQLTSTRTSLRIPKLRNWTFLQVARFESWCLDELLFKFQSWKLTSSLSCGKLSLPKLDFSPSFEVGIWVPLKVVENFHRRYWTSSWVDHRPFIKVGRT